MATKETENDLIEKRPGVCGGSPCVQGTRTPVWSIVESHRRGLSVFELQGYFTSPLTADEIRAALDYYQDHREEIEAEIRANEEA